MSKGSLDDILGTLCRLLRNRSELASMYLTKFKWLAFSIIIESRDLSMMAKNLVLYCDGTRWPSRVMTIQNEQD